jgi:hypothetical protein
MNRPIGAVVVLASVCAAALAGPEEKVSQERLMETIGALPPSRSAIGGEASRDALRRTEAMLEKSLRGLGYEVQKHEFKWALPARKFGELEQGENTKPEEHTYRNLIVEVKGKELPHEVFIVGAHFDTVPGTPGADDNGSGVAALLELARALKDEPLKRTVRLVFFNLEEVPLAGSSAYVKSLRAAGAVGKKEAGKENGQPAEQGEKESEPKPENGKEGDKIIGMMSLETIGFFSDEPGSQKSPIPPIKGVFEPPTVGDGITLVGFQRDVGFVKRLETGMKAGASGLKVYAFDFPMPLPDLMRSDHAPFYAAGVPAAMLTDTANFRNPNYHKPTDTIETIDGKRLTLVVKGLVRAVVEMAGECDAAK